MQLYCTGGMPVQGGFLGFESLLQQDGQEKQGPQKINKKSRLRHLEKT